MSRFAWNTLFALALALSIQVDARCAEADPEIREPDVLFRSYEPLEIRITAALRTLMRERPDVEELEGTASWVDSDGETVEVSVALRTRGNYRRQVRVCPFAPIRLNFKTSEVEDTLFHKQDKLKIVTHCRNGSSRHTQVLLREYLTYRILNELTDISYRVRLLRVTYVDTDTDRDPRVEYAVAIESRERFAKRTGLDVVEIESAAIASLDPVYTNLMSVFQYFIGNTDFSPIAGPAGDTCCHNTHLFGGNGIPLHAVPYDFDMSGMINAPYATPNPRFRLRSVRERLYRGRCVNNEHVPPSVARFQEIRDAIYEILEAQEGLSNTSRRSMKSFIDSFYRVIDSPDKVESKLVSACLN